MDFREHVERLTKREIVARTYWPKLGIKKPFPAQQKVLDAWLNGATRILLRAGRRGAKTMTPAMFIPVEMAFGPPGNLPQRMILHSGPKFDVTDRVGAYLWKWVQQDKLFGVKMNPASERERYIQTPWGARVEGKTTLDPDSLLGEGLVGSIADEHARDKPAILAQHLLPPLADTDGWIALISTPRGRLNHFHETEKEWKIRMEAGDPRYYVGHWTSYDNPYIDHSVLDDYRLQCERTGQMDLFHQEILAEYTSLSGSIYSMFKATHGAVKWHVKDRGFEPHPDIPFVIGIDFGFKNQFVALKAQLVDGEIIHIFDEIAEPGLTDQMQVERVYRMCKPIDTEMLYCDPSGAGAKQAFRDAGYSVFAPSKGDAGIINNVKQGIVEVRSLFSRVDKPAIVIHSRCVNLIEQLYNYQWKENSVNEEPEKLNDHGPDALRYLVMGTVGLHTQIPQFFF